MKQNDSLRSDGNRRQRNAKANALRIHELKAWERTLSWFRTPKAGSMCVLGDEKFFSFESRSSGMFIWRCVSFEFAMIIGLMFLYTQCVCVANAGFMSQNVYSLISCVCDAMRCYFFSRNKTLVTYLFQRQSNPHTQKTQKRRQGRFVTRLCVCAFRKQILVENQR